MCNDEYRRPRQFYPIPPHSARFAAERYKVDSDGCWISTYSVASHGYAQIGWTVNDVVDGKWVRTTGTTAHRAAWVHHNGKQIPEGMTVDHTCRTRRCVNPDHLRLLSNIDNATDNGWVDGSRETFSRPTDARCPEGHVVRVYSGGNRNCRECATAWTLAKRARAST